MRQSLSALEVGAQSRILELPMEAARWTRIAELIQATRDASLRLEWKCMAVVQRDRRVVRN
jgi:hypothetical protein